MTKCKICDHETQTILPLGMMPISNAFVKNPDKNEYRFDLSVVFCPICFMVQLGTVPDAAVMFNPNYAFFSMTSVVMQEHFKEVATEILEIIKDKKNPFVVELGSNDGVMLRHIHSASVKHLGVEPAQNVAEAAEKQGISVLKKFFGNKVSQEIVKQHGKADAIFTANSLLSIENLNDTFEGFAKLLADDGVLIFEDPYVYDIVKLVSFDQIYDEHIFFFSGLSVSELGKRHGLQLVNMKHQDVHGGSMRYYLKKGDNNEISPNVDNFINKEKELQLNTVEGYKHLRDGVNKICDDLKETLTRLKKEGHKIAAYGATSKSTTLFNYSGIGPELIDYITDNTPTKIDHFTPGVHIPVYDRDHFLKDNPPYTLLLAWNHQKEIFEKEKEYREKGGKFITYFPEVKIV